MSTSLNRDDTTISAAAIGASATGAMTFALATSSLAPAAAPGNIRLVPTASAPMPLASGNTQHVAATPAILVADEPTTILTGTPALKASAPAASSAGSSATALSVTHTAVTHTAVAVASTSPSITVTTTPVAVATVSPLWQSPPGSSGTVPTPNVASPQSLYAPYKYGGPYLLGDIDTGKSGDGGDFGYREMNLSLNNVETYHQNVGYSAWYSQVNQEASSGQYGPAYQNVYNNAAYDDNYVSSQPGATTGNVGQGISDIASGVVAGAEALGGIGAVAAFDWSSVGLATGVIIAIGGAGTVADLGAQAVKDFTTPDAMAAWNDLFGSLMGDLKGLYQIVYSGLQSDATGAARPAMTMTPGFVPDAATLKMLGIPASQASLYSHN